MSENFDQIIDRSGTACLKYDARRAVFGREHVIPLWVADMDFAVPAAVSQALMQRAGHPIYGYTLFPDALYQATQQWYTTRHHWQINQAHLLFCPGVVPSLHAVILALTEPGDKVIVQPPVYFPFFSAVSETARELLLNPLQLTDCGYQMNFDQLEQHAADGAKMLLLCSPHNPAGRVWTEVELQRLLAIARRYQLIIISDEIHADLVFDGHRHVPLDTLAEEEVSVITAISASKTFNIAGLGLSALVIKNKTNRRAIEAEFNRWHVSAANPFSIEATLAAYQQGADWLDALLSYVQQNRDWITWFFEQQLHQIKVLPAEGTYLLWLNCRDLALDDQQLKQFFVEQCHVGMNPGQLFGEGGSGFMRMNIAAPLSVLKKACQQIKEAVMRLPE